MACGAAPLRGDHCRPHATIRRHGGQEHRRRPPRHIRRPDAGHPLRRGRARDAETLGIEIRAAIHTGECELLDADIGGLAVHIAARILGQAGAGEILVSRTVRDLVVGSGTGFEDRGSVELRGVPGIWQLLAVDRHGARAGSAEAELASMPTPGRRTAMRRSDRAVEVIGRRAPWILRGMARLAGHRPPLNSRSQRGWRRLILDIVTGESYSDATGADASVVANGPTFTSCLDNH